jgi:hypothetical protein
MAVRRLNPDLQFRLKVSLARPLRIDLLIEGFATLLVAAFIANLLGGNSTRDLPGSPWELRPV